MRRNGYFVAMKCVRADECSQTVRLNLNTDGNVAARLIINKKERLFPLILLLKAFGTYTD